MLGCRAAGDPGDPRMAAYFAGEQNPRDALAPRTGYVAVAGGAIVGYIAGHRTTRLGCDGEVQYLYVHPSHRRHGVGTSLMRALASWMIANGARKVCVDVDIDSPPAAPFYQSLGAHPQTRHWYVWEDIGAVFGQLPEYRP